MAIRIESTVVMGRPVEEVFSFFMNLDQNAPRGDPDLLSVVKSPQGPTEAGTIFRFRQKMLGRPRETTTRFTSIEAQPEDRVRGLSRADTIYSRADLRASGCRNESQLPLRGQPRRSIQTAVSAHQAKRST